MITHNDPIFQIAKLIKERNDSVQLLRKTIANNLTDEDMERFRKALTRTSSEMGQFTGSLKKARRPIKTISNTYTEWKPLKYSNTVSLTKEPGH